MSNGYISAAYVDNEIDTTDPLDRMATAHSYASEVEQQPATTNGTIVCSSSEPLPIKRTSISSSSSSASKSHATDDADEEDLRYGCCAMRPTWLQWMNNIVGAVTLISLANCLQGFANGSYGVVVSTIEKRFDLSSSQSSIIAIAYEIGAIPIIIVFMVFGTRIHRPISMAVGLLAIVVGCVLFFIPQFTIPPYRPHGSGEVDDLCIANRSSTCDSEDSSSDESLSYYLPVFVVARILVGMGATPILTVGVNYIDDCSTKEKFAKYVGIYMAMSVAGPAIGLFFGAGVLLLFCDFYMVSTEELGISPSDPSWVGAWWLPQVVAAGLCLLNAIPMWGYPRDLPGAAEVRAKKVTEAHKDDQGVKSGQLVYAKNCKEWTALIKVVMTNPTYLFLTLVSICDKFIIAGLTFYGAKFYQYQFHISPMAAGVLFAAVMLPAGVMGTLAGGKVIQKFRLSCSQIIRLQAVFAAITALGCLIMLILDDTVVFAGVTVPYGNSSTMNGISDTCNANCSCDGLPYDPICGHDDIQYYSPCHAGCTAMNATSDSDNNYYNCSCVATPESTDLEFATSGQCSSGLNTDAIIFLSVFFCLIITLNWGTVSNAAATLRCVSASHTTFAYSVQILISKLFGTIPGPLLMGLAFDSTCILWQPLNTACSGDSDSEAETGGSCLLYDNAALAVNMTIIMLSVKGISVVATLLAAAVYRPPHIADDEMIVVDDVKDKPDVAAGTSPHNNDDDDNGCCVSAVEGVEPSNASVADSGSAAYVDDVVRKSTGMTSVARASDDITPRNSEDKSGSVRDQEEYSRL